MTAKVDGRTTRHQHRRPELLSAATEYVLENGLSGLSLRAVAKAIGISHAGLIRHFASRDDLLSQVLESVRQDFLSLSAGLIAEDFRLPVETVRAFYMKLCEHDQQRQFRLLFELVGQSVYQQGRLIEIARLLVDDWLTATRTQLIRLGCPLEDADPLATLLLAQIRGLQLDLILTRDVDRVNAAVDVALSAIDFSNWLPTT